MISRQRVVSRLAWRELRARPWRTLLVAVLVSVPVAGMVVATVLVRTDDRDWYLQSADSDLLVWDQGGPTPNGAVAPDIDALLPGAEGAHVYQGFTRLRTADGERAQVDLYAGDVADPLARGVLHVLSGRLPTAAGEVALSPSARDRLDVEVGDVLELARPEMTLEVVGSVVQQWSYNAPAAVFGDVPDQLRAALWGGVTYVDLPGEPTPAAIDDAIAELELAGFGAQQPFEEPRKEGKQDDVNWTYVIGTLVLLVVGIVIAAAFAVGARRQLHTLGMLAGNGAERGDVRSMLLVEGALCGAAGVVLGLVLATVLLVAAAPHRNRILDQVTDGWTVQVSDVVPIVLIGIAAAVLAAVQPARSASRVSVLQALAGQRPSGAVPGWLPTLGVVTFGAGLGLLALAILGAAGDDGPGGTVWTLTAILGGVAIVLGTTACAPAIVARLEPLAARLRGTWRLSARSLARQRSRASGVVAAISATGALAIGGSALLLSSEADERDTVQRLPEDVVAVSALDGTVDQRSAAPVDEDTVQRVVDIIGPAERVDYRPINAGLNGTSETFPMFNNVSLAVADDALVDFLDLGDDARAALRAGAIVVIDSSLEDGERRAWLQPFPAFDPRSTEQPPPPASVRVDVVVVDAVQPFTWDLPNVLVPEAVVAQLDIDRLAERVLLRAEDDINDDQEEQLEILGEDLADEAPIDGFQGFGGGIAWNQRSETPVVLVQSILAAIALGFTLLVVAIGLGLAAAEGRAERDVLVAVGAPPRTLSRLAGTKAAVLAVVGGVLAIPTAMLPVWVFTQASSPDEVFVFPWFVTALLVLGVPAVAGLATSACSAIGARVRPVQASGFASD